MHEHVPGLAQNDGLLAAHAVGSGDCDCGVDCAHLAIVDRPRASKVSVRA